MENNSRMKALAEFMKKLNAGKFERVSACSEDTLKFMVSTLSNERMRDFVFQLQEILDHFQRKNEEVVKKYGMPIEDEDSEANHRFYSNVATMCIALSIVFKDYKDVVEEFLNSPELEPKGV